jgi:Uncharacterized protein conserved in bacteria
MNEFGIFIIVLIVFSFCLILLLFIMQIRNERIMRSITSEREAASNKEIYELKEKLTMELLTFQNQVTQSLKGDFTQLNETTVNRLMNIESKVNESMLKGMETTNKTFASVLEKLARIDETQQNLQSLSENISNLQSVLTDKKTRGTFGEVELYSILESVFGANEKRFLKQYKLSSGNIADAVLLAPEPLGKIAIDSKFPLENYNKMYDDNIALADQQKARLEFKKDVAKHLKAIADKYVSDPETAEFAYMFVPAEAVFAEIYGRFDDLIQLSYQYKVYIVSPTTLMAYITAIKAIYLGQERNEKVVLIQQEFAHLAREFSRFESRFEAINKDFDKTYRDLQSVSVTAGKINRRFKQIEAVELSEAIDVSDDVAQSIQLELDESDELLDEEE